MGISKTGLSGIIQTHSPFDKMVSLENLFSSWDSFKRGKCQRADIQVFERHLEDHIFALHHDLISLQYQHGPYYRFHVFDPKERCINGASVRDRLVHQVVHSTLSDLFDSKFIFHSFACRLGKGTHQGIFHLDRMIKKVSLSGKGPCYALKMDIRRFFDSMNQSILKDLIRKRLRDERILNLTDMIIESFKTSEGSFGNVGVPLGNVTSQLFGNIYLHELDDFIKQELREPYYLRYCDDFILLSSDKDKLKALIPIIASFLQTKLQLELHPKKVLLSKLKQGIDFLGYVLFPKHILLRTRTKQRMLRRLKSAYTDYFEDEITPESMDQRLQSYLGVLSHTHQRTLSEALRNAYGTRGGKWW